MSNRLEEQSVRYKISALLAVLLIGCFIAVLLFLSHYQDELTIDGSPKTTNQRVENPQEFAQRTLSKKNTSLASANLESKEIAAHITMSHAIGNVDCRLRTGSDEAQGIAVIALPNASGLDFSVIDDSGSLFHGTVPFNANHIRLGVNNSDSVLVGFADLRLNSSVFRPPNSAEPIMIFHDGHLVFKNEKVWDFDIAEDGSSFVVHEPAPGGASRLIIRDFELGKETHHDLGTTFTPKNDYSPPYAMKYTLNNEEIHFEPAYADAMGKGDNYFYPVRREGKPRRMTVEGGLAATFADSTNMFFVDYVKPFIAKERVKPWTISHKELDYKTGSEKILWKRTMELMHFSGTMRLSTNGKWLALSSWDYTVVSTDIGDTKLKFPIAGDDVKQLKLLRSVLPKNPDFSDMGEVVNSSFSGDKLVFSRTIGNTSDCYIKPGEVWDFRKDRLCERELRLSGKYRTFQDVFDLNIVPIDGSPTFRMEVINDTPCSVTHSPLPHLYVDQGEMKYGVSGNQRSGMAKCRLNL